LSSADWSTFSGKVGGSGVAGQVAYWDGTNSQAGSSLLNFNTTTNGNLMIGTNVNPGANGSGISIYSALYPRLTFRNSNTGDTTGVGMEFYMVGTNMFYDIKGANNQTWTSNATDRMRLYGSTGNLQIGTLGTSDNGQRLQVYGDAFVKGSGSTSATSALLVQNSAGSNFFAIRNDGLTEVVGNAKFYSTIFFGGVQLYPSLTGGYTTNSAGAVLRYETTFTASVSSPFAFTYNLFGAHNGTSADITHSSFGSIFSPTSGNKVFSLIGIVPTINQTGGANGITRGLYVNPTLTSAADWRSIEWSNNSGWGLYGAGTANNYFGGSLGIGSTTLSNTNLAIGKNISGSTSANGVLLDSVVQSGVTSVAYGFRSILTTQATSFTLSSLNHFTASQTTQGAGSIILNQVGFDCGDMNNAYTNISYRGQISQGTLQWNLYMSGTASNYLAGQLLIGTTTKGTFALDVNGTARVSGVLTASTQISVASRIDIFNDGANGCIAMQTLTNTLNLRKYVKVLGDDGGFGNNNASAALQIDGTNRGFLPPRLTTTQKNAIATPAAGLQVYDTTLNQMSYYNGTTWINF